MGRKSGASAAGLPSCDGFSRNPSDRDELIAQRSRDLQGRTGQLRGFSLEGFLSDYEEGSQPYPWTLGDHAIPESELTGRQLEVSVLDTVGELISSQGVRLEVNVLMLADAESAEGVERRRKVWELAFRKLLPHRRVEVRAVGGPFEDETTGVQAHFDKGKKGLSPAKLVLSTKRDGLTALVGAARHVYRLGVDVVVGEGQGGVVALGYAKPALLEVALQARNVQREEVSRIAGSWGKVRMILAWRPRLGKAGVGVKLLESALPEAFDQSFPVAGPPAHGIMDGTGPGYEETRELLEKLGVSSVRSISEVDWQEVLSARGTEMWEHDGLCACGRRTYLFGRCGRCLKEDASTKA